jgi:hypothetical protein
MEPHRDWDLQYHKLGGRQVGRGRGVVRRSSRRWLALIDFDLRGSFTAIIPYLENCLIPLRDHDLPGRTRPRMNMTKLQTCSTNPMTGRRSSWISFQSNGGHFSRHTRHPLLLRFPSWKNRHISAFSSAVRRCSPPCVLRADTGSKGF